MIAAIDDPEVERLIRELQLSSATIVPLSARGRTLGAMTYVWAESGRTYSSADSPSPRPSRLASRWYRQRASVPGPRPRRPDAAAQPPAAGPAHDRGAGSGRFLSARG